MRKSRIHLQVRQGNHLDIYCTHPGRGLDRYEVVGELVYSFSRSSEDPEGNDVILDGGDTSEVPWLFISDGVEVYETGGSTQSLDDLPGEVTCGSWVICLDLLDFLLAVFLLLLFLDRVARLAIYLKRQMGRCCG